MNDPCFACGEPYELTVLEWWPKERAFLMDACCEEAYEDAVGWLNEPPGTEFSVPRKEFVEWFRRQTGCKVRGIWNLLDSSRYPGLSLDYGLKERPITQRAAKAWVRKHHRHLPDPPAGWKWGHSVWNGRDLVGVAMVGGPVGRWSPTARPGIVEVTRVAIDPNLGGKLVWNAASKLYGAAAKEAKRRGYKRIITYTRADETGTSLRAAGWERGPRQKGRKRVDPRGGRKPGEVIDKYRWTRWLTKERANPTPLEETQFHGRLYGAKSSL